MKTKPSATLHGILMLPLRIGSCAWVLHTGGCIRTSCVVDIQSIAPGEICFETQNTHYRLLDPIRPTAENRPLPGMAA